MLMFFIFFLQSVAATWQAPQEISQPNAVFSDQLWQIVNELNLGDSFDVGEDGLEQISLAVIDLNGKEPVLGGVYENNFIYPASVYKMYVAAAVLHQIDTGNYGLDSTLVVMAPNDVDKSKEIRTDPRPLLKAGDSITVHYALDLMITRSDNSAANCLIDLAEREKINALMHTYGWQGSEVTRKFLSRKVEDAGYKKIRSTETNALHAVQFLYLIEKDQLVSPWVSRQLKLYLGMQLDDSKLATGLPGNSVFYHKTGWFSYWTHDAGIVKNDAQTYIVACFLPLKQKQAIPVFKRIAEKIHALITNRQQSPNR